MVEKIKKLCSERNISIHRLEVEAGIGNGVISGWDEHKPSLENLVKVAKFFGISLDDIVEVGNDG